MKALLRAAAVLSLLTATACLFGPRNGADAARDTADSRVEVNVTHNYSLPVEVYASASGMRYGIGLGAPGIEGHFKLRRSMLASGGMVEFVAKPVGTEPPVLSGEMLLKEGDVVEFEIATHLIGSYAKVRP